MMSRGKAARGVWILLEVGTTGGTSCIQEHVLVKSSDQGFRGFVVSIQQWAMTEGTGCCKGVGISDQGRLSRDLVTSIVSPTAGRS
jgi:hypothetical protein